MVERIFSHLIWHGKEIYQRFDVKTSLTSLIVLLNDIVQGRQLNYEDIKSYKNGARTIYLSILNF